VRPELVRYFEHARVPRYTSYPTAVHFGELEPATFARWLGALDPTTPLSLYVHIPWCRRLCWYCGCHTWISARQSRIDAYVELLLREIELVAHRLPEGMPVVHLHFGGGTPSTAGPRGLARILETLRRHFVFRTEAEIAIELDPREVDEALVDALAALGFTRVSLGVQTLDPAVQEAVGRIQPAERVFEVVERLRRAGLHHVSADLMYGLPRQTVASAASSAARLAELGLPRFAVFGYAHLPALKRHQRLVERHPLPDAAARVAQFEAIADTLTARGYRPIGLDHFARPEDELARAQAEGRLHRNFQGYTADPAAALVGFGASAISDLPQGYAQAAPDLLRWRRRVERGELPTTRGRPVDRLDRAIRAVIERIMCDLAVDLAEIAARFALPVALLEPDPARFAEVAALGLVEREGSRLVVPEAVRPLLRVVAACFDRYLTGGPLRHAAAL